MKGKKIASTMTEEGETSRFVFWIFSVMKCLQSKQQTGFPLFAKEKTGETTLLVHTFIYAHTSTHINLPIHTHTHSNTHTQAHAFMYLHTSTHSLPPSPSLPLAPSLSSLLSLSLSPLSLFQ